MLFLQAKVCLLLVAEKLLCLRISSVICWTNEKCYLNVCKINLSDLVVYAQ
jgi:hypothetical protein